MATSESLRPAIHKCPRARPRSRSRSRPLDAPSCLDCLVEPIETQGLQKVSQRSGPNPRPKFRGWFRVWFRLRYAVNTAVVSVSVHCRAITTGRLLSGAMAVCSMRSRPPRPALGLVSNVLHTPKKVFSVVWLVPEPRQNSLVLQGFFVSLVPMGADAIAVNPRGSVESCNGSGVRTNNLRQQGVSAIARGPLSRSGLPPSGRPGAGSGTGTPSRRSAHSDNTSVSQTHS